MSTGVVSLLTGATGMVGRELLARILRAGDSSVLLAVRAGARLSAAKRVRLLLSQIAGGPSAAGELNRRVEVLEVDFTRPGPDLRGEVLRCLDGRACRIVHGAANVAFDLPLDQAREVNVGGTTSMLKLAESLHGRDQLERFAYVSTAFVAGARNGVAYESEFDTGQSFTNTYERSKFEAEAQVRERVANLPVDVFRPSIVAGDSVTGAVHSFKVLYWPLHALVRRQVPCIPARANACYDIVPVDFVARALLWILGAVPPSGRTYHLSAGRAVEIRRILEMAAEEFHLGRTPPMVPPALFRVLFRPALALLLRGPSRQVMLRSGKVYIPYLSRSLSFDHAATAAALAGSDITLPDSEAYLRRVLRYARETDFGRRAADRRCSSDQARESQKGQPV